MNCPSRLQPQQICRRDEKLKRWKTEQGLDAETVTCTKPFTALPHAMLSNSDSARRSRTVDSIATAGKAELRAIHELVKTFLYKASPKQLGPLTVPLCQHSGLSIGVESHTINQSIAVLLCQIAEKTEKGEVLDHNTGLRENSTLPSTPYLCFDTRCVDVILTFSEMY